MRQIFIYSYSMTPLVPLNVLASGAVANPKKFEVRPREGVLIKVISSEGFVGYSDLHPWPELGDITLAQQLTDFHQDKISPQIERSLELAQRDARARAQKVHLFSAGELLKNNFLLPTPSQVNIALLEDIKNQNFTTLKLKVGKDRDAEVAAIERAAGLGFKVRLDFNAVGTPQSFEQFMSALSEAARTQIEYVEDPCPFDVDGWNRASQFARLALDNQYDKVPWQQLSQVPFDVIIIKPAKTSVSEAIAFCLKYDLKTVVTNYMDHPVGVVHAASIAMELKKKYKDTILEAGCLTHRLFKSDEFSRKLETDGPYLLKTEGFGVGFDELLEALPWQALKKS